MELAESLEVAVPSAADSWTSVGTFTVPTGVSRLKELSFSLAPDWGLSAASIRMAPTFRVQGSGLLEQSPHDFIGVFGGHAEVTTGMIVHDDLDMVYEVDIPVQAGGTYQAEVNTLDEAITAGTVMINAIYDDKAVANKNSMAQYVDAAMTTTADAYAVVGTFTLPKLDTAKDPTKIKELVIGLALDQGTSAISLRSTPIIRLSGAGIKGSGRHDYHGPIQYAGEIGTTPSQGVAQNRGTRRRMVDIDINPGGQILVEHKFIVETPTAGTIAVGIVLK